MVRCNGAGGTVGTVQWYGWYSEWVRIFWYGYDQRVRCRGTCPGLAYADGRTTVTEPVCLYPFRFSLSPVRVRDYGPTKDTG